MIFIYVIHLGILDARSVLARGKYIYQARRSYAPVYMFRNEESHDIAIYNLDSKSPCDVLIFPEELLTVLDYHCILPTRHGLQTNDKKLRYLFNHKNNVERRMSVNTRARFEGEHTFSSTEGAYRVHGLCRSLLSSTL